MACSMSYVSPPVWEGDMLILCGFSYPFVRVRPRPRSLNRFRAITRKPLNIFQRNLLHALIII